MTVFIISLVASTVTSAFTVNTADPTYLPASEVLFAGKIVKLPVGKSEDVISTKEGSLNTSEIDVNVISSSPVFVTLIVNVRVSPIV